MWVWLLASMPASARKLRAKKKAYYLKHQSAIQGKNRQEIGKAEESGGSDGVVNSSNQEGIICV